MCFCFFFLEIQGLLGSTTSHDDSNVLSPTNSANPSPPPPSSINYGLKLLKKPMNILNGNLGLSSSSTSSNSCTSTSNNQNSNNGGQQISDNKINALFESYRDEECEDAILAPGIERLCCDLQYKPEDFAVLVLAWRLDASQMCRFTKTEFIQGLHTLNADSIASIRQRLEEESLRLASDAELFKNLYRFTFR